MPIWDSGKTIVFERSSDGQTAQVLGEGDALLATCDDAGAVKGADGATLATATFVWPRGVKSRGDEARIDVAGADGSPLGVLEVRRFGFGPFSKKLTIGLRDAGGADVGEMTIADKKGRELSVTAGGAEAAQLAQVDRDRSLARTVERWSLQVKSRPPAPADLLAAAAVLRYGKFMSEIPAQANRG
jgi:hypothetical protein